MEKSSPFGRIEEISTEFGEAMCEILTVLAAEEHGLEEVGEDADGGFFNVSAEREEWHPGQGVPQRNSQGSEVKGLEEQPPKLEPELDLEAVQPPVAAEAVAVPAEGELQSSVKFV